MHSTSGRRRSTAQPPRPRTAASTSSNSFRMIAGTLCEAPRLVKDDPSGSIMGPMDRGLSRLRRVPARQVRRPRLPGGRGRRLRLPEPRPGPQAARAACTATSTAPWPPTRRPRKAPHAALPAKTGLHGCAGRSSRARPSCAGRYGAEIFLLYLQAFSGTHAPVAGARPGLRLRAGLRRVPRADRLHPPGLHRSRRKPELLASYRERGLEVWVELGLQSACDATLAAGPARAHRRAISPGPTGCCGRRA